MHPTAEPLAPREPPSRRGPGRCGVVCVGARVWPLMALAMRSVVWCSGPTSIVEPHGTAPLPLPAQSARQSGQAQTSTQDTGSHIFSQDLSLLLALAVALRCGKLSTGWRAQYGAEQVWMGGAGTSAGAWKAVGAGPCVQATGPAEPMAPQARLLAGRLRSELGPHPAPAPQKATCVELGLDSTLAEFCAREGASAWGLALRRAQATGRRVSGALVAECVAALAPAASSGDSAHGVSGAAASAGEVGEGSAAVACVEAGDGGSDSSETGGADDAAVADSIKGRPIFMSSRSCEWYTPAHVLERVRQLFGPGGIDLDPASSGAANERVGARAYIDAEADGLAEGVCWGGNVFINPPFGVREGRSLQGLFFERCVREFRAGCITQAVLVLKASVGYGWFREVFQFPVCFVWERLSFVRPQPPAAAAAAAGGAELPRWGAGVRNPHGSVVVYMGPSVAKFVQLFGDLGCVPGANAWAHHQN